MQEVGRKKSEPVPAAALARGLFLAGAGTAAAAINYPDSATVGELSGGTEGPIHAKSANGVALKSKSKSGTNVATWELTYAPEREADWHWHPDIIIAVVKEGTVTRQVALGNGKCIEETFTKVEPHKVKNPSTTEAAVLSITAIHATDSEELTTPRNITCK